MNHYLQNLEENRKQLLDITQGLSTEEYNFIPGGYKNNIIWNMGHMLDVSENILYKHSAFKRPAHNFDNSLFGRGTKPDRQFSTTEIALVRLALAETVSVFEKVTAIAGTININRANETYVVTEEALQFLLFHEKMHYRTIIKLTEQL